MSEDRVIKKLYMRKPEGKWSVDRRGERSQNDEN
jgi:hypothetical protein